MQRERWMAWKARDGSKRILHVEVQRCFRTDRGDRYAVITPANMDAFRAWPWKESERAIPLTFLHKTRETVDTELALVVLGE